MCCVVPALSLSFELDKPLSLREDESSMSLELLITEKEVPLMRDYLIFEVVSDSYQAPTITVYSVKAAFTSRTRKRSRRVQ